MMSAAELRNCQQSKTEFVRISTDERDRERAQGLGELGALAAALFVRLTINYHWNFYAALALATVVGLLLGGLLELALVPRLRRFGPTVSWASVRRAS